MFSYYIIYTTFLTVRCVLFYSLALNYTDIGTWFILFRARFVRLLEIMLPSNRHTHSLTFPKSCHTSGFLTCPYCVQALRFQSSAILKSVSPTLFIPKIRPRSRSCRLSSAACLSAEPFRITLPVFGTLSCFKFGFRGQKDQTIPLSDNLSFGVAGFCSQDEALSPGFSRLVAGSEASTTVMSGRTI